MPLHNKFGQEISPEAYKSQVLEEVAAALDASLWTHMRVAAFDQLEPQDVAALMISTLPVLDAANPLADRVGPCYDTKGVQTILGRKRGGAPISKQAVEARRSRGTVLALSTSDDRWVYPLWQFDDGDVRRDVVKVLSVFDRVLEPRGGLTSVAWSVASWFTTPAADLDGMAPITWLTEDEHLREVEKLAARTAGRWAA